MYRYRDRTNFDVNSSDINRYQYLKFLTETDFWHIPDWNLKAFSDRNLPYIPDWNLKAFSDQNLPYIPDWKLLVRTGTCCDIFQTGQILTRTY